MGRKCLTKAATEETDAIISLNAIMRAQDEEKKKRRRRNIWKKKGDEEKERRKRWKKKEDEGERKKMKMDLPEIGDRRSFAGVVPSLVGDGRRLFFFFFIAAVLLFLLFLAFVDLKTVTFDFSMKSITINWNSERVEISQDTRRPVIKVVLTMGERYKKGAKELYFQVKVVNLEDEKEKI
ncbi:hypothetical protein AgCh_013540 [Apium graveolens]